MRKTWQTPNFCPWAADSHIEAQRDQHQFTAHSDYIAVLPHVFQNKASKPAEAAQGSITLPAVVGGWPKRDTFYAREKQSAANENDPVSGLAKESRCTPQGSRSRLVWHIRLTISRPLAFVVVSDLEVI